VGRQPELHHAAGELTAAAAGGRRFRPRPWPTLLTLAALAVLLALGTWQLCRLAWKEDLIARAEAGLKAPAAPLPPGPLDDPAALDFRRVAARGAYLHDAAFAFGLTARAGEAGARLVTPLALADGRTLLVDRGWLPSALLPPAVPDGLEPAGEVVVEGVARDRSGGGRGPFQPADDPAGRRWYAWDLPAMAAAVGRPLLPVVLVAQPGPGGGPLPHAEPVVVDYSRNHLGYALTWYGIAAGLVAVYLAFSLQKRPSDGGPIP
jgi:surfeit locus 1 family protein